MENLEQLTLNKIVGVLKELTGRLEEIKETSKDEKLVYTPKEAAKVLGIGNNAIYNLLKDDEFPKFSIGRNVYISKKGLEDWVEKQTKK